MSILEIIKKRRSIRKFKPDPISEEVINKLIEAVIWAPSAGNKQMRKFFFVINNDIKKEIALASLYQMFIEKAPLVIVACGDKEIKRYYGKRGLENYLFCDVAASVQNLLLVAAEQGLGTCWIGAFNEKKIKEIVEKQKISLSSLKTRKIGGAVFAELKLKLSPRLKLDQVSSLSKNLEKILLEKIMTQNLLRFLWIF